MGLLTSLALVLDELEGGTFLHITVVKAAEVWKGLYRGLGSISLTHLLSKSVLKERRIEVDIAQKVTERRKHALTDVVSIVDGDNESRHSTTGNGL